MLSWVDFTRRNDPATPKAVPLLDAGIRSKGYPKVLCFWTKSPGKIADLYRDHIRMMRERGTLVLLQATINNYNEMESSGMDTSLNEIVGLLGRPRHVRLRFDPIIIGYTRPSHFRTTVRKARRHDIDTIITNFLVPEYKGVGDLLQRKGFDVESPSRKKKISTLKKMLNIAKNLYPGLKLKVCAETADIVKTLPQLGRAACADPEWAVGLQPDLKGSFTRNPSRDGCGCVYEDDFGEYRNNGAYRCPHGCLYCYAK